jgi:uncharacterized membrane protein YbhN (UPF0104 family)
MIRRGDSSPGAEIRPAAEKESSYALFLVLLKITVSLVLIMLLFRNLALRPIWEAIRSAQLNWLLIVFSLYALGYLISAFRRQILLGIDSVLSSLINS